MQKTFNYNQKLELEQGEELPCFTLAYHTFGKLNKDKSNVVWICHALTANSNPLEWWPGLVGENCYFNPEKHFIVCANMLSSCYGSTGPLSDNPDKNKPYYLDFPPITIRDIVQSLDLLRKDLGIESIQYLVGGSMGGQQAMEWAYLLGEKVKNLVLLATNARHSSWGIAFNESQRMAIAADNTWGENRADAAQNGLKAARAIALLSYRNYDTYCKSQVDVEGENLGALRATTYQQYQGEKLAKRFNAYSYWYLSKAMDSHNIGRKRGGVENALKHITAKTLVIGILTDLLFPVCEQKFLAGKIPDARYAEIKSLYGHDGFLLEFEKITKELIQRFAE